MEFNDKSNINENQKMSLKGNPVVLKSLMDADEAGEKEINITSKETGYHKDLFVFIDTGLRILTAYFQGDKLMSIVNEPRI